MIIDDREFHKYILISFILYLIIFLLSAFIFPSIYQMHTPITKDTIRITSIQDPNDFFERLLINNLVASFIIVIIGGFGSRLIPLIFLSYNAFYLGELVGAVNKPDTYLFIYAMMPHAIIELPTIIISASLGCYLAYKLKEFTKSRNIFDYIRSRINILPIMFNFGVKPYFMVIFPLIILGCIIESYISLYILRAIFNGI